jgi:hypothetical protein
MVDNLGSGAVTGGPVILLSLRAALAAAFAIAATAKALSSADTRESLQGFGLPSRTVPAGAVALPALEAIVAVSLIVQRTATAGAWVALALLLVFGVAIAAVLRRGEAVSCNCFGALSAEPVGPATLARNSVLAAVALAVALLGPGGSVGQALAGVSAGAIIAVSALVVVLAGLAAVSWQLMRQNGRLLARVDALEIAVAESGGQAATIADAPGGLPVGHPAPPFEHDGEQLPALGETLVLAFTDPHCPGCQTVRPMLVRARATGSRVAEVQSRELAIAYRAHGVPAAVVVDDDGLIASELVHGADAIEQLLGSVSASPVLRVEQR